MWKVCIIALAVIIMDHLTKWSVVVNMELGERIPVIESFFYITSHRNQGAAWGILEGQMMFFYIITVIVIGFILVYSYRYAKDNRVLTIALGLILGGAVGNFIDRIVRKEVVDFFDFYIFNYNFPIFNIADSALVVGVIFIFILTFVEERNKKKEHVK